MSVERHIFPSQTQHAPLLRMLLALDGSTTRICEAVANAPVELLMLHQSQTTQVPQTVHEHLGGENWLMRVTSLHAKGQVLMDNLSYTRLDATPKWFLHELEQGLAPIGHLLKQLFIRREIIAPSADLSAPLWQHVALPDENASRAYKISTPQGPLMLIFEAYRAGMISNS